ncbi:hypothetical protein KGF56_002110 [Candida oxycetoniae]|uniref:Exonuclease domain-containing protein n=1 Tax=Candida oxycetoniae TaxID=497107 RepID=A0AAI9SXX8_9ASCO|nr:uncharacterized protein KGF56_002110 [Candida oxycetoniae]KAI3405154.2 hypothetical protein KGF56_002110 [Candida oxycetoniae]
MSQLLIVTMHLLKVVRPICRQSRALFSTAQVNFEKLSNCAKEPSLNDSKSSKVELDASVSNKICLGGSKCDLEAMRESAINGTITAEAYLKSNHFAFQENSRAKAMAMIGEAISLVSPRTKPMISIDCESHEISQSKITEVGISILKASTFNTMLPMIKPMHIIIKENIKRTNHKFVPNNKNYFSNGVSYLMTKKTAAKFIKLLLDKYLFDLEGIFVGHAIEQDIKYLEKLGVKLSEPFHRIDTFKLHRLSRSKGGSLASCLKSMDIPHAYLHNAGNDAYYTLLLALAYCDPATRILKNLDQYTEVVGNGKKKKIINDKSDLVVVDDVEELLAGLDRW